MEAPRSIFELDSAHLELKDIKAGERWPGRGSTAVHEEDHRELESRELVFLPREQIRDDSSLGVLHDVEEGWGELQARQRAAEERAVRATRPSLVAPFEAVSGRVQANCRSSGVRGSSPA